MERDVGGRGPDRSIVRVAKVIQQQDVFVENEINY